MPHSSTDEVEDVIAVAFQFRIPTVVDNLYVATPLFKILDMDERIIATGGTRIEQPFLFDRPPGGSYRGMDTMDITRRKTKSLIQLEWKQYYSAVSIDGLTRLRTAGDRAIIDLVDTELQGAELRMKEDLGTDSFLDGTGNFSKTLDGFAISIATTGTYGGIARATDPEGTAVNGNVDTTGGAVTLPAIQTQWGAASFGAAHPTLLVTTQVLFNSVWNRIQPQQRFPQGAVAEELAKIGFNVIMFNGVPLTVDQMCPAGVMLGLNTNFIKLVAHESRADIEVEGPLTPTQQDARTWRLMWMGNLVHQSPRTSFRMTGLT